MCFSLPSKSPAPTARRPLAVRWSRIRRRGTTAAEFAIIAIPFFILILAVMEVSWQLTTGAALEHAALRASRYGATGSNTPPTWQTQNQGANLPTCRSANIRWLLTRSTGGMIKDNANLLVSTAAWSAVNGAGTGTGTQGAGNGGQIVSYTITFRQPFITGGLTRMLWGTDGFTHRAFLLVKNEPFSDATC